MNVIQKPENHQAEARWSWWCGYGYPALCPEQRCLQKPEWQIGKTTIRHRHAVQHLQQRRFAVLVPPYARTPWLDFCGSPKRRKVRANRASAYRANRARAATKQGELVWAYMACIGQHQWLGNIHAVMAKRCICPLEATRLKNTSSCPYGGLIAPRISPYSGHDVCAVSPYSGLIWAPIWHSLSPYSGHLLVIPLHTFIERTCQ